MTLSVSIMFQWKSVFQTVGVPRGQTRVKVWHCWETGYTDVPVCGRNIAIEVVIYPDGSHRCTSCISKERQRMQDILYDDTPTDPRFTARHRSVTFRSPLNEDDDDDGA